MEIKRIIWSGNAVVGVLSAGVGEERISTGAFHPTVGKFHRICMFYTITSRHVLYIKIRPRITAKLTCKLQLRL